MEEKKKNKNKTPPPTKYFKHFLHETFFMPFSI